MPCSATPVGRGLAGVLVPTRGGVANGGNSPPLFNLWGTPPTTPARGPRPLEPHLPTPVGRGLAGILGPTRGGVANVGYSPPLLVLWGAYPPRPPARGLRPPGPPFLPTPVGLGFASVLGPTRGWVANGGNSPPLLVLWGDTPHNPPPWGLRPPGLPIAHPRGLRVRRRFRPHSWWVC